MFDTLLHTLKQYKLYAADRRYLVAVSGGMDSVALLHALVQIREQMGFYLHVATLDHGLRGQAAEQDVLLVQKLCEAWALPLEVGKVDTNSIAELEKLGIEAAARKARYDFLAASAQELNIEMIITAHHADDLAETILMNILRGAGLDGLQGMRHVSPMPYFPNLQLVRPLLDVPRDQIHSYAQINNLSYRFDETNSNTAFLRNKLRIEILPQLQAINPQVQSALLRLSKSAQLDLDYLEFQFHQETSRFIKHAENEVLIDKAAFDSWHPTIQVRCLRHCVSHINGEADIGYKHLISAVEIVQTGKLGAIAKFPGNVRLRIDYQHLVIEPINVTAVFEGMRLPAHLELPVKLSELITAPDESWIIEISQQTDGNHIAEIYIPKDAKLMLRTRRPGDRIQPRGINGHSQKLKQWFIDRKIPRNLRDNIPLLIVNQQIAVIFILGKCYITETFVTPQDKCIVVYLFTTYKINQLYD